MSARRSLTNLGLAVSFAITLSLALLGGAGIEQLDAMRVDFELELPQSMATDTTPASSPANGVVEPVPLVRSEGMPDLSGFISVRETYHFSLYAEPNSFAASNIDYFAEQAETLLREMEQRLNGEIGPRVPICLYGASNIDYGGLTFFVPPLIYMEYGVTMSKARAKALIAHELTHLIAMQDLGYPDDLLHLEGIAEWASEAYWTAAVGQSYDKRVERHLARSTIVPLADLATNRSLWQGQTQLLAYDEAGSFVGYLIHTYGLGHFKKVYMRSNYSEVYGKSLSELESDWHAYLNRLAASAFDAAGQIPFLHAGVTF